MYKVGGLVEMTPKITWEHFKKIHKKLKEEEEKRGTEPDAVFFHVKCLTNFKDVLRYAKHLNVDTEPIFLQNSLRAEAIGIHSHGFPGDLIGVEIIFSSRYQEKHIRYLNLTYDLSKV